MYRLLPELKLLHLFIQRVCKFQNIKHSVQFQICPHWWIEEFWTLKLKQHDLSDPLSLRTERGKFEQEQ